MSVQLFHGDCLDVMPTLIPGSVDAIITDLPYGTTACEWDSIIPLAPMWEAVKRVLKPNGVFVTTASQPFTSILVTSNLKWFRYEWVWRKSRNSNPFMANFQPLRHHENILVFGSGKVDYYPQKEQDKSGHIVNNGSGKVASDIPGQKWNGVSKTSFEKYPKSVIDFSNPSMAGGLHPTQKPVALYEYLIRTYTNPGETVLDITMGSGTTGVAAMQTGRNFIGIEKDAGYFAIAEKRILSAPPPLFVDAPLTTPAPTVEQAAMFG